MFSIQATASSSALCASIGPSRQSPMAQMPGTDVLKCASVTMRPRPSSFTPTLIKPRFSVNGLRPMETRTMSVSILVCAPPAAGSSVTASPFDVFGFERAGAAILELHLDLAGTRNMRFADNGFGFGLLEQKLDALGEFAHHFGLVAHHAGQIEFDRRFDAELGEFRVRFVEPLAGVQQRLGRDAADVQAGAPEAAALVDAGGGEAQLSRTDRGIVATRPTADDDDIELVAHFRSLFSSEVAMRSISSVCLRICSI